MNPALVRHLHEAVIPAFIQKNTPHVLFTGDSFMPTWKDPYCTPFVAPNIVVSPGPVIFQSPLQHPEASNVHQRIRIRDRMYAEREVGIFLSYFMHVERDAWLNEVCMG